MNFCPKCGSVNVSSALVDRDLGWAEQLHPNGSDITRETVTVRVWTCRDCGHDEVEEP